MCRACKEKMFCVPSFGVSVWFIKMSLLLLWCSLGFLWCSLGFLLLSLFFFGLPSVLFFVGKGIVPLPNKSRRNGSGITNTALPPPKTYSYASTVRPLHGWMIWWNVLIWWQSVSTVISLVSKKFRISILALRWWIWIRSVGKKSRRTIKNGLGSITRRDGFRKRRYSSGWAYLSWASWATSPVTLRKSTYFFLKNSSSNLSNWF